MADIDQEVDDEVETCPDCGTPGADPVVDGIFTVMNFACGYTLVAGPVDGYMATRPCRSVTIRRQLKRIKRQQVNRKLLGLPPLPLLPLQKEQLDVLRD